MHVSRFRPLFVALACLSLTGSLFGQGISTGSITGMVQDQKGAVVTSAKVTAVQNGTNMTATAVPGPAGDFSIRSLLVGTYQVTIEATGFDRITINNVAVNAGTPTTVGTQTLGIAGTTANVSVEASTPLLQTDPMQTSATFETKAVQNLPIGNGFDSLALLVPGVATTGDANFANTNGANFATNGQRGRDNNFQVDGQANNDTGIGGPVYFFGNQDAVQEVQVLTNYSAEYGRNTGAIINYITKQGTNEFHGTAFELYNGNWADSMANQDKSQLFGVCPSGVAAGTPIPGFDTGCTLATVPRYVDNRFGGTLGGPIWKNKLWFFGSANWERQTGGNSSASSGGLLLPDTTGLAELTAAFPGNPAVAALKAIGPTTVKVGTLKFGTPTIENVGPSGVPIEMASLTRTIPASSNDDEYLARIDWQLSDRDRVFGRYAYQHTLATNQQFDGGAAAAAGDFENVPGTTHELGIDFTHTFSNSILNQTRFNYLKSDASFNAAGFPTCLSGSIATCPTNVAMLDGIFDGFGLGPAFPQSRNIVDYQTQDNASIMHGRHSFKFGGEYSHQSNPNFFLPFVSGTEIFAGGQTTIPLPPPAISSSFDDFIGSAGFIFIGFGNPSYEFHEHQGALYFQDDWRVRDNLTISAGVRWELYGQAINSLHDSTVARESNPKTALWSLTDTSGAPSPLSARTVPALPIRYKNFSPIVGFSYSPKVNWLGRDQTVIRGGFRIAYDPEFYNILANIATSAPVINLIQFAPCSATTCVPAAATGPSVQAANPFPPSDVGLASQEILPPSFRNPYTEQWSFGIQHEFGSKIVAEVRYVGNHGLKQFQFFNANPALGQMINYGFSNLIPAGLKPCTDTTQAGFFGGLEYADCKRTGVSQVANTGFSMFHGLEARLDTRQWHNMTLGASYTYSHTIDNTSEIYSSTGSGGNTLNFPQNVFNLGAGERANSGIDYPNVIAVYALYDVPFFHDQSTLKGKLLGGWQIDPLYRYTSGQPYTVIQNFFNSPTLGPSICDSGGVYGGQVDACRPILNNPFAPFNSIGVCQDPTAPDCAPIVLGSKTKSNPSGTSIPLNRVHWLQNDPNSAVFKGTPFAGAGRDIQRGQVQNTINLTVLKDYKFRERYTFEIRATAYNLANHQFRGNPSSNINSSVAATAGLIPSFGNNFYNSSGAGQPNSVFNGIDRRRIEVGAKILF